MAIKYKILGQVSSVSGVNVDLYTVPSTASAVCSTLVVCNRDTSINIRVAVRPGGVALSNEHYVIYDNYINQYDSLFLTFGLTLAGTDVVTVFANSSNISFSLYGSEIS